MKISSLARINFSIIMLCVAVILFANTIGVMPDERSLTAKNRAKLCKSIATNVTYLVARSDLQLARSQIDALASSNDDLVSVGLRRTSGELVLTIGDHGESWSNAINHESDGCYVVPIENRDLKWGTLELQFKPLYSGRNKYFSDSLLMLVGMVIVLVGMSTWLFLKRILQYLDPSRSVPPRVREALDNFAEGVVILDTEDRIVLANHTFAKYVRLSQEKLLGVCLWDLPWEARNAKETSTPQHFRGAVRGSQLSLIGLNREAIAIFSVNSSPIIDEANQYQGLMMAFTDVTPLELSRAALEESLSDLQQSKKEITIQNEELRYLATRDPLTSCINRRTFFELFEQHWKNAKTKNIPLCGMMVDIDFFKAINDNYGHSMGDDVLRKTGALLNELARKDDVVCRYGGEEFAILMPGLTLDEAESKAEAIRIAMSKLAFPDFSITASLGVSGHCLGANDPQDMLDQADKCLYVAKRNGRNKVVRFDTVPKDLIVDESKISRVKPTQSIADVGPTIPYAAVTALLSALSFRDHQTGAHSSRVSAYAALLAQRVLSAREVFVVEMAALLHDIGKVGVPDAILLKPGKLTADEWEFMEKHDRIGVEIINRSFRHQGLTDVVKYHHYWFDGSAREKQVLHGQDIPIGARILAIVDSFDAMTSDRPYRKGMPKADALTELRRFAGKQFDPELIEHFAEIINSGCEIGDDAGGQNYNNDVVLSIGEQVERLVEAADSGDAKTFVALAERLRNIAQQHHVDLIASAASNAIKSASEDAQLKNLVEESYELLSACRSIRTHTTNTREHALPND